MKPTQVRSTYKLDECHRIIRDNKSDLIIVSQTHNSPKQALTPNLIQTHLQIPKDKIEPKHTVSDYMKSPETQYSKAILRNRQADDKFMQNICKKSDTLRRTKANLEVKIGENIFSQTENYDDEIISVHETPELKPNHPRDISDEGTGDFDAKEDSNNFESFNQNV